MLEEKKQNLSIQEVKQKGGLAFPLDWEDIAALKNSFVWVGTGQLSNGTLTIYHPNISPMSVGVASHQVFSETIGVLSVSCGNGYATITSSSNTDNSIVNIIIIF